MANQWHEAQGWRSGCNYVPANAVNQIEMWQESTYDRETIDKEFGWAEEMGFSTMRVFLHSAVWRAGAEDFKKRIDDFLGIADSHGIKPVFVFFDDCWNAESEVGPQPAPKPGVHNSGWVRDPADHYRQDTTALYPVLKAYVQDILKTFGDDDRILWWDLYNEPGNSGYGNASLPLVKNVFKWAREIGPSQPLSVGVWNDGLDELNDFQLANSDIISYHDYGAPEGHAVKVDGLLSYGRPVSCTEYMRRQGGSTFQAILPMLKDRDVDAINWGFVSGKTNTIFGWNDPRPDGKEPEVWFHDIIRADKTPFDPAEIEAIKRANGVKYEYPFWDKLGWWQEARYGMFVHWGISSLIGREISWSRDGYGAARYDALSERFNPVEFDADKWIDIAEAAGMKYIVLTAKHHDGFCLWDSEANPFNIMHSPYGKDVCRMLADACHRRGMKLGWYFSTREWSDEDCCTTGRTHLYVEKMKAELTELLTHYGKVDLLWFDFDGWPSPARPMEIVKLVRELQPDIIYNNRLYPFTADESHACVGEFGMYCTPEQFVGGCGDVPWETCSTMSTSRQWSIRYNDPPRPAEDLEWETVGAVAGNGNMLMNVGPDSLGVIPHDYADRLAEVGDWIRGHDGILYGASCGPWKPTSQYVSTVRGGDVWLLMREGADMVLPYDKSLKVKKIFADNGISVPFSVEDCSLSIDLPSELEGTRNVALKVVLKGSLEGAEPLVPFSTSGSVSYNRPSEASSSLSDVYMHFPASAFDDNESTAWLVGRADGDAATSCYGISENYRRSQSILNAFHRDVTLGVDLGEAKDIVRFRMLPRGSWESASLEYFRGGKWVEAACTAPFDSEWTGTLPSVNAGKWRLSLHSPSIGSGVSEFQLFDNQ